MKRNLLKTFSLALAFILLLSACACGGNGSENGQQTADNSAAPTEAPTPEPTEAPTPEPTAVPTPEPTAEPTAPTAEQRYSNWSLADDTIIEAAFPFAEAIGAVHNVHYSPELTSVQGILEDEGPSGYRLYISVGFGTDRIGHGLAMHCTPDENGCYIFKMQDITLGGMDPDYEAKWIATYPEDIWADYQKRLQEARFIITPEDIAAVGCTATEGEEYLLAVGRCWQQKYAEFFMNLPENYPGYCYDMQPLDCSLKGYVPEESTVMFYLGFASRPLDLRAISYNYFEGDSGAQFADESYPPEIYGWLVTYGGTMLEQQEDGSWVGTTSCHTFG